jgi:enterochelin esterase-like enzyme
MAPAFLLSLLILSLSPPAALAADPSGTLSPTLSAILAQPSKGRGDALSALWKDVGAKGAPLVEAVPDGSTDVVLTFLWRTQGSEKAVIVFGPWSAGGLDGNQMQLLPETDLWFKSYRVPARTRLLYRLAPVDFVVPCSNVRDDPRIVRQVASALRIDPLNPRTFSIRQTADIPESHESRFSVVDLGGAVGELPFADAASDLERFTLSSARLGNERRIWVYRPPEEALHGQPPGLLLFFDGGDLRRALPLKALLDRLIAARSIPPVYAVLIDHPDAESRQRELGCDETFITFLVDELLPWVRSTVFPQVDGRRTVVAGFSRGGLAAVFAALRAPQAFGRAVSLSGAFWFEKPGDGGGHEWLARQFVKSPTLPLRFVLQAGDFERGPSPNDGPSLLVANRHLRDVLLAKSYDVVYQETPGGHDILNWGTMLPEALQSVWR